MPDPAGFGRGAGAFSAVEAPLPPHGSGGCCGRRHRVCAVSPALVGGGGNRGGERRARLCPALGFCAEPASARAAEFGAKWGLSILRRLGLNGQGVLWFQGIRLRSDSAAPPQLKRIAQQAGQQQRAAQIPPGQATGRREHPPQPFHRDLLHPDRRTLLMTA